MSELQDPKLTVSFERISSAVGYGYLAQASLVHPSGDVKVISTKFLHCVFGDRSGLLVWHTEITPDALGPCRRSVRLTATFGVAGSLAHCPGASTTRSGARLSRRTRAGSPSGIGWGGADG